MTSSFNLTKEQKNREYINTLGEKLDLIETTKGRENKSLHLKEMFELIDGFEDWFLGENIRLANTLLSKIKELKTQTEYLPIFEAPLLRVEEKILNLHKDLMN